LRLGKLSAIMLLNRVLMPLVYVSSPCSTPMICNFGLFMVSQIAFMFHSYFLSILLWSFTVWSNSSTLSSVPYTLFSTCSTLINKLSIVIFIWDIELFISDWLFFRVSISLLISPFISWIVFLISFICLYFLWVHLIIHVLFEVKY
jgi:hypothetical protein